MATHDPTIRSDAFPKSFEVRNKCLYLIGALRLRPTAAPGIEPINSSVVVHHVCNWLEVIAEARTTRAQDERHSTALRARPEAQVACAKPELGQSSTRWSSVAALPAGASQQRALRRPLGLHSSAAIGS